MYYTNIARMFFDHSYKNFLGTYKAVVKTGEVYVELGILRIVNGFLMDRKDRPRDIMTPSEDAFGPMQSTQHHILGWTAAHTPGFVYARNSS